MGRNLSRDRIVDAAIELIETEGLDSLSMRRLGRRLGVEGMAVYSHVRDKSDLLDAVAERVLAALDTDFDHTRPWRDRIRRAVVAWAALQEAHPHAFPLVYRTGLRTDAVGLLTEELIDALRTAGFDKAGAALAYQTIVVFVDGALLGRRAWDEATLESAWLEGAARADSRHYPRFTETAPHAAKLTWEAILESGLSLLLDGLEARVRVGR